MTPLMMRRFWSFVEQTQANILLTLDDVSLEQWLINRLCQEQYLDHNQTDVVSDYIRSRLPLIREIAHAR